MNFSDENYATKPAKPVKMSALIGGQQGQYQNSGTADGSVVLSILTNIKMNIPVILSGLQATFRRIIFLSRHTFFKSMHTGI